MSATVVKIGSLISVNDGVADGNGTLWYMTKTLRGWLIPNQRIVTVGLPGRPGAVTVQNLYDAREIGVTGLAKATTEANLHASLYRLVADTNALNEFTASPLQLFVTEEIERFCYVVRTSLSHRMVGSTAFRFEVTFRADNPTKYTAGAAQSSGAGTLNNGGNAPSYPTFTSSAPGVVTLACGSQVWTSTASLPSGTVVDMRKLTAMSGVSNLQALVDPTSVWWALSPGNNTVTSSVAGTFSWRNAWL